MINDELSKIRSFQKKTYDTTIAEYVNTIQPFKQSLSTSSSHQSVSVSAVSDYTLPMEFAPDNLRKNLDVQFSTLNKSLMKISGEFGEKFRSNKNKLSKEEAMVVAVQAVITSGLFYLGRAEKHKTLQKIGEEVCEYCLNKEGVISSYGRTQSVIQRKYKMIERMIDSVNKLLPQVRIMIEQGKSFQQLNSHEIKVTKDLYFMERILKGF
ncbi:MAG: hypothetical protein HC764_25555 [Pleurocapsa sp. CRU_1_2]|nr:hypothetical protein [Pleurocapsa sp. CRU_1_2]